MGLVNTITSMVEELNERQRREELNARRRAQRQAAREAEEMESETETNSLLGFAMNAPRTEGSIRQRGVANARDNMRRMGRPQNTNTTAPSQNADMDVASYHNSRYAGNSEDQGRPYYMPPPLDVGYDIGRVLAEMNQRFLENRQRSQQQRAIQVAQFQAANRVRNETSTGNTLGPINPPPGTENPGGVSTVGNTSEPNPNALGTSGGSPSSGGGLPFTGLPTAGDALGQINRWQTPRPILWNNTGN